MEKIKEIRLKIEEMIENLEDKTKGRYMNDLEEGEYTALIKVLNLFD